MKKINKKLFILICLIITSKSFAVYTYSLSRTDLITPIINSFVASEMTMIISEYKEIESIFENKINLNLEKKNSYNKLILQEKALGNTLIIEIKELNNDISNLIYFKDAIK